MANPQPPRRKIFYIKVVLFSFMLVLFIAFNSHIVIGTEYTYKLYDRLNSSLKYGDNWLGYIILERRECNYQTYEITVNKTNYTLTVKDSIINKYQNNVIQIGDKILLPNERYIFSETGRYDIFLSNNTKIGWVIVKEIPNLKIDFKTLTPSPAELTYKPHHLVFNLSDIKSINLSCDYDDVLLPYEYELRYMINNKTYTHVFNITPVHSFGLSSINCRHQLILGESGIVCNFSVYNSGNTNLNLNISINNSKFSQVIYFYPQPVFISQYKTLSLFYDLSSSNLISNNTLLNVSIFDIGSKASKSFVFPVSIKDAQTPTINHILINHDLMIGVTYNFTVTAKDNLNLTHLWIESYASDIKERVYNASEDEIQAGRFTFNYTPSVLGQHKFIIYAEDISHNINHTERIFNVTKLKPAVIPDSIKFPKQTRNKYIKTEFLYMNYTTPLRLKLVYLDYGDNCSWQIRLTKPDKKEVFLKNQNDTILIKKRGRYMISFKGACTGDYNGELELSSQDKNIAKLPNITFSGSIVAYTIPQDINNSDWNGGKLVCKTQHGSSIDTTYYKCQLTVPIELAGNGIIPITQDQLTNLKYRYNQTINHLRKQNHLKNILVISGGILIIICILGLIFYIKIYPELYIKA